MDIDVEEPALIHEEGVYKVESQGRRQAALQSQVKGPS